ncbi:uncharacterized protein LOC110443314 [Mizuhopecten yessoensis]|uniref:J domain-containing protein n=1 Tax=Mizuhopecten yessoensis TaxID=6573 RepID=A0A210PF65_MIZYE|nr:uncharacterized protein LOC110443314 [Mizuhopecten yessoensis]XP_021343144.1 uncharacterized protein LOC110443314 [Mizuhopecten yessoensis]OWF35133.1 hypothetical protein KP79_PYT19125 [Mizuhopecten yessoensis]
MEVAGSQHWRQKGNGLYASIKDGLSPVLKRDRLQQAANCYYKALSTGITEDDKMSASKNLAMTAWRRAQVEEISSGTFTTAVFYYKEAFKYFSTAVSQGQGVKPNIWIDDVKSSAKVCWEGLKSGKCSEMDIDDRINVYYDVVQEIKISNIRGGCFLDIAQCHFHIGVTAVEKGSFERALSEMRNCHMPLHEAVASGKGEVTIEREVKILEVDVFMHQCMAESMQARSIGDQLYHQLTMDEETLNMDMAWEVVDWYKLAIIRTREVTEVELEALALSRLGCLYDKVLKMKDKAKRYLIRSMQLAHSMHPRTFTNVDWFKECSDILQAYQRETVSVEEEEWNKEKEELKKEIKKELADLTKAEKKEDLELLDFLYKEYPPKKPIHKKFFKISMAPKTDYSQKKEYYKQAVVNYHPDRADVEKYGKIWKILTEEITKILTNRYQRMK